MPSLYSALAPASSTDVGNGVVVSLDNGTTWLAHVVPGSTPSLSDPSVAVGINDVGLLTAPDGTVYAMAIMTIPNKSDGSAQELMRDVTKAVIAEHRAGRGPSYAG